MNLIEPILADAAAIAAIRRDIHAHPELCFEENRTADLVAKCLTDWGLPIHRGLGKTGVVGIVRNGTSSIRSTEWIVTMCGWLSAARSRASRSKRALRSGSAATWRGSVLMATWRSRRVSRAR